MLTLCFASELCTLMKDQDDGVRELKIEQENRVFNHCFTGTTVLVLLMSHSFYSSLSTRCLSLLISLHRCNSGRVADCKGKSEK